MVGAIPRRLLALRELPLELLQIRGGRSGIPEAHRMVHLQRACARAGGVPGLTATALASYTLAPNDPAAPEQRANGRRQPPTSTGAPHRSRPDPDPDRRLDLRIGRPLLVLGLGNAGTSARYAAELLTALVAVADRSADPSQVHRDAVALARALEQLGSPLAVAPDRTGDELVLAVELQDGSDAPATILGHVGAGVVHGALGAATDGTASLAAAPHWETARRLDDDARRLLRGIVGAIERGAVDEDLIRAATCTGIPEPSARTNLPRLVDALAPLRGVVPTPFASLGDRSSMEALPTSVGVLRGISDLLAARAWLPGAQSRDAPPLTSESSTATGPVSGTHGSRRGSTPSA